MQLEEFIKSIKSISDSIKIIDSYTKISIFDGEPINYVAFQIGEHYYLASKSDFCVLTEQNAEGTRDLTPPKAFILSKLRDYIRKLTKED